MAEAQSPLARSVETQAVESHKMEHPPYLAHHFETVEQQFDANIFGMWVFLVTELMLFGGLFTAYTIFRYLYPGGFVEGSNHLNVVVGSVNTVVLICSSLTVALAVYSAQVRSRRALVLFLGLTILLGVLFLGFKAFEYYEHFQHQLVPGIAFNYTGPQATQVELFLFLYFVMTGVHAIHMIIGLGVMTALAYNSWRGRYTQGYYMPVEMAGLYWHFVDIVWIFLFPLLYLIGRHA